MQDKDLFNGVIGRYTDRNEENGIGKKDDDKEIASIPRPRKPHIHQAIGYVLFCVSARMHFNAHRFHVVHFT